MKRIALLLAVVLASAFEANAGRVSPSGSISLPSSDTLIHKDGSGQASGSTLIGNDTTFFEKRQDATRKKEGYSSLAMTRETFSVGFGLGMDYGGIGSSISYFFDPDIAVFFAGGYALADFGYNIGAKFRVTSGTKPAKVVPYLLGMYGYNAVVQVKDKTEYSKIFYGVTFGVGIDFKPFRTGNGYWTFGLLVPIRGSKVDSYIDELKNEHGVKFDNELYPVGLSIGYRIVLE
jgi:hypothetical protein